MAVAGSLEAAVEEFKTEQKNLQGNYEAKQKLQVQEQENRVVLDELKAMEDDAVVFKMVGPIMLKKDKDSSKENVEKRLEYIREELGRTEKMCTDGEEKLEKIKNDLIKKQQEAQAKAAEAAAAGGQ